MYERPSQFLPRGSRDGSPTPADPLAARGQAHVETLAQRLASFAPEAIRCAKEAVLAAERMPHSEAARRARERNRWTRPRAKTGGHT